MSKDVEQKCAHVLIQVNSSNLNFPQILQSEVIIWRSETFLVNL